MFGERPLFHHIIETLLAVTAVSQIVVDTDSPVIADQCSEFFPAVACIRRPDHLLGGDIPMTKVLAHDARLFPSPWYLQTHSTNPLLRASTIAAALNALESSLSDFDSLFSVTRLQTRLYDAHRKPLNHDPDVLLRTQDLPPVYEENSNMYIFTQEQISAGRRFGRDPLLYEVDRLEAADIDEERDFLLAELMHVNGTVPR